MGNLLANTSCTVIEVGCELSHFCLRWQDSINLLSLLMFLNHRLLMLYLCVNWGHYRQLWILWLWFNRFTLKGLLIVNWFREYGCPSCHETVSSIKLLWGNDILGEHRKLSVLGVLEVLIKSTHPTSAVSIGSTALLHLLDGFGPFSHKRFKLRCLTLLHYLWKEDPGGRAGFLGIFSRRIVLFDRISWTSSSNSSTWLS